MVWADPGIHNPDPRVRVRPPCLQKQSPADAPLGKTGEGQCHEQEPESRISLHRWKCRVKLNDLCPPWSRQPIRTAEPKIVCKGSADLLDEFEPCHPTLNRPYNSSFKGEAAKHRLWVGRLAYLVQMFLRPGDATGSSNPTPRRLPSICCALPGQRKALLGCA